MSHSSEHDGQRARARAALPAFPIFVQLTVQWGDMDAFQHVNNVVYLRWFETARMALFQAIDFTSGSAVGPILHSTSCRYRLPLYFPDDVVAACRVTDVQEDRFAVETALWSAREQAVAATGTALMVAYDYAAKQKARLPDDVRTRIAALR